MALRDSKDMSGPVLRFDPGTWSTFVDGVKAGGLACAWRR
ncbi:DUF397 domain-containing protein [Solwaraspora sp. WMMA2065]|nr:DUF397 domain-containing protein [Solwaraspora sp. WMMA2065]WJK34989.1 DUF397 domain-containing protein [Solwaraspora sp. WMMA2065]